METYLQETSLLDFNHPSIKQLVAARGWKEFNDYDKIGAAYNFVQNEITFGYNRADDIPASAVLHDGYGQCNTKGTLLMALLRALDVACRFHGFTIDKHLQKGAITRLAYWLAPKSIVHSWVEVWYQDHWVNLEGFILDTAYLCSLQAQFSEVEGAFCGYGVAVSDFKNPSVMWQGRNTYIQVEGINHDYGVFSNPDTFYNKHGGNLRGFKALVYKHVIRHQMNTNVQRIRDRGKTNAGTVAGAV